MVDRISSRQNATVKRFRALARSPIGDQVLLEGAHLVEEALATGVAIETAAFSESAAGGPLASLVSRAERLGCPVAIVADAVFPALSPVQNSTGAVAIARLGRSTVAMAIASAPQLVLIVDGVQDPGNIGAIIRAAEGCGATGVIVGSGSADPFGWKALRGSMGSTLRLPVVAGESLLDALDAVKMAGVQVVATAPRGGTLLSHADLRRPVAVILGGEGRGIPESLLATADQRITIPMRPPVESLNVAVAAALVLYEASRQRADVAV